jgi:putative lipase involved disintegration of autophagic bodies
MGKVVIELDEPPSHNIQRSTWHAQTRNVTSHLFAEISNNETLVDLTSRQTLLSLAQISGDKEFRLPISSNSFTIPSGVGALLPFGLEEERLRGYIWATDDLNLIII